MDLGFHRAGYKTVWFCEAVPNRRKVLRRHFPGIPVYDDLKTLDPAKLDPVDVFIGGTPCQDLSGAGKRAGLIKGERSSLFFDFIRVRDAIKPEWTVWENVAGVFVVAHLGGVRAAETFVAATLTSGGHPKSSAPGRRREDEFNFSVSESVRRLTPTERERLMGAPDGWTYTHGPSLRDEPNTYPSDDMQPLDLTPDGPRESATGDGVVTNCAEWIGKRLREFV